LKLAGVGCAVLDMVVAIEHFMRGLFSSCRVSFVQSNKSFDFLRDQPEMFLESSDVWCYVPRVSKVGSPLTPCWVAWVGRLVS
jgi:hypothetical protein